MSPATARLKVRVMVKQGIAHDVAMEEVMDQLANQTCVQDELLAKCMECLNPDQMADIFGDSAEEEL